MTSVTFETLLSGLQAHITRCKFLVTSKHIFQLCLSPSHTHRPPYQTLCVSAFGAVLDARVSVPAPRMSTAYINRPRTSSNHSPLSPSVTHLLANSNLSFCRRPCVRSSSSTAASRSPCARTSSTDPSHVFIHPLWQYVRFLHGKRAILKQHLENDRRSSTPFTLPYLFVFIRSACAAAGASSCPFAWPKSNEEHPHQPHASTSTRGSVSLSVASVGTIISRCDLSPASQQVM